MCEALKLKSTKLSFSTKKKLHCMFKTIQGWIFNHTDSLCISECTNKCGARYEAEKTADTNIQRRCCCSKQADAAMQWLIIERCSSRADYKPQRDAQQSSVAAAAMQPEQLMPELQKRTERQLTVLLLGSESSSLTARLPLCF